MNTVNNTPYRSHSTRLVAASLIGALGLGMTGLTTVPAAATPSEQSLQTRMGALLEVGYPAVLATVTDAQGGSTGVAVGLGDKDTGASAPVNGQVRIGSNTKTFVAVVVMQLVQEGRVQLDEPVETHLPGLLRGEGVDGSRITVRQLLQHTSGLPEYTDTVVPTGDFIEHRNDYLSPRELLDVALAKPAAFEPGDRYAYTNTNYIVLGMLIEKVTRRTVSEQIDQRIVQPLGLHNTYMPHPGERFLRGAHPQGYHRDVSGELVDVTEMEPAWGWAAGSMVSTPGELNIFFQALLDGTLLSAESLAEMQRTVTTDQEGSEYGLGLIKSSLSCGEAWGHGGTIHGYQSINAVGPDGTAMTLVTTAIPLALVEDPTDVERIMPLFAQLEDTLETTLCQG
ncbi:MAG: serine hydrolase domain-containing protein [Propionibacteriaceae bacterium]|nr:serine hydrolase domain-containing protein [Propionibacteriaceae bacterium]